MNRLKYTRQGVSTKGHWIAWPWNLSIYRAFRRSLGLVIFLQILAGSGCRESNQQTTIEIKNFSTETIVVQQLPQFKTQSGEIRLRPAVINTIKTDPQVIPEDFSIHWKFERRGGSSSSRKSNLSIAAIPESQRTSKIVLEFTNDQRWIARFE